MARPYRLVRTAHAQREGSGADNSAKRRAGEGTRTPNPFITSEVRCQLRHAGDDAAPMLLPGRVRPPARSRPPKRASAGLEVLVAARLDTWLLGTGLVEDLGEGGRQRAYVGVVELVEQVPADARDVGRPGRLEPLQPDVGEDRIEAARVALGLLPSYVALGLESADGTTDRAQRLLGAGGEIGEPQGAVLGLGQAHENPVVGGGHALLAHQVRARCPEEDPHDQSERAQHRLLVGAQRPGVRTGGGHGPSLLACVSKEFYSCLRKQINLSAPGACCDSHRHHHRQHPTRPQR